MPSKTVAGLSDEALYKEIQAIQAEIAALQTKQEELALERRARAMTARTNEILDGLDPDARNVLIQAATARAAAESVPPGGEE